MIGISDRDEKQGDDFPPHGAAGYKRPPHNGRFLKGRSGNPRGRPRKRPAVVTDRRERALFFRAVEEEVWITQDGKRRRVNAIFALYRTILSKGLQGHFGFAKLAVQLRQQFVEETLATQARLLEQKLAIEKAYEESKETIPDKVLAILREADERISNPLQE